MSGGLDTTLVGLAARLAGLRLRAVTVYYAGGLPRDLAYALYAARVLGFEHHLLLVDDGYISSRLGLVLGCTGRREVIEARNDVVFLAALEWSAENNCKCIYTGDGGDELFAGYTFLRVLDSRELVEAILRLGARGRYPALELGDCIGVRVEAPLLNDEVLEAVLEAPVECIRGWLLEGKGVIREILERHGLYLIASRLKTPAEEGAGTSSITPEHIERLTGVKLPLYAAES